MSDGISYRVGYLSGRLRCYENEEEIVKILDKYMNSSAKFLQQFKRLERRLKEISGTQADNVRFSDVIKVAKRNNPVIEYKEGLIWDLYGLRNVFAHSDREKYIAQINELAFESIGEILSFIDNPPKVGDVFSCEVYYANTNEITENVLRKMQKNLFTHVPIYDEGKFVGLLTETTLLDWLMENINQGQAQFYKKLVSDINPKYLNSKT
ncbi:MAG: CBS domain-containing protein, partial [Bacteroidales bacterium]|nr:CBS domain-containing protein [Bacteroidales bacterium]